MTTPHGGDPDSTTRFQEGRSLHGDGVPTPPGGVRGVDQVDNFDNEPGQGTTTGADGETPAREQLRQDLGERPAGAGSESDDSLEQAAALGAIDDPQGGSIQADGSQP